MFLHIFPTRSCYYGNPCQYLICGLHLYVKEDNSDETRLEQLKYDIKELQSKGVLVKLAYGGEEWGNSRADSQVKLHFYLDLAFYLALLTKLKGHQHFS